jgi:hypothetical protein
MAKPLPSKEKNEGSSPSARLVEKMWERMVSTVRERAGASVTVRVDSLAGPEFDSRRFHHGGMVLTVACRNGIATVGVRVPLLPSGIVKRHDAGLLTREAQVRILVPEL